MINPGPAWILSVTLVCLLHGCGDDDGGDAAAGGTGAAAGRAGGAAGSAAVSGEDGTLSVELFWDQELAIGAFVEGSCEDAGVAFMEWQVLRSASREVVTSSAGQCGDAIDLIGLPPGDYELHITGETEDGELLWSATCTDLRLEADDISYDCDVPAE